MLIEFIGFLDGLHVEAPMLGEFLIFRSHDCEGEIGRDLIQIHPMMAEDIGAIMLPPRSYLRLRHE